MTQDEAPIARGSNSRGRLANAAVLQAATSLFSERGYSGVSIADIAEAAGVTKPSVLYHYPDKETLWKSVVHQVWTQVDAFYAAEWPRGVPPSRDRIERVLRLFVDAAIRWPPYIRIPFIEGATPSWRSEWLADRYFGVHLTNANRIIEGCQRRGLLEPGDPARYHALFTSAVSILVGGSALWARCYGRVLDDRETLIAQVRMTLDLTFRSEGT